MSNKKQYNVKDQVWIHIGEPKLVEGRVVDFFDLEHLKEGHSKDLEYYVIEVKTPIDPVYEVRTYDQISSTAKGPINLFNRPDVKEGNRFLKKIGIVVPVVTEDVQNTPTVAEPEVEKGPEETTPQKPKKRFYHKRKKPALT